MLFIQYRIFVDECICYECIYKAKFRSCTKLIIKSRLLLHLYKDLEDKELALAFRLIPKDKAAEVFANMNNSMQTYLVEMFSEKELKELLDDLG